MPQPTQPLRRTEWAERHVEEFLSLPFISEFVFRSPQTADRTQREVADFLVAHGQIGVLISQKCQEDPLSRSLGKTESWVRKEAKRAVAQLRGALRTAIGKPVWWDHPRRGRVQFPNGLPKINHGVVMVEVFHPVDLEPDAAALPLDFQGTPISYFSVNDLLNLAAELRTTPELLEYLNARRLLPPRELRVVGDERSLFEFYLLNNGSMAGCVSRVAARKVTTAQHEDLMHLLRMKAKSDHYSKLLEHVADALATRNPDCAKDISPAALAGLEPLSSRSGYLEMQGVLSNLRLPERAELGRAFHNTMQQLSVKPEGFVYTAWCLDSKPDLVLVFGSSKKVERRVLLDRMIGFMRGAMAFYRKERCLMVMDRDGVGYEVGLGQMQSAPTPEELQLGNQLFGHLGIIDRPLSLVPDFQ